MTVTTAPPREHAIPRAPLWNTFDTHRAHLYNQFRDIPWAPNTGLTAGALADVVRAYLADHADMPRVLLKANVFRIVVTQARIAIDPLDWFVDKLDHGHLVRRVSEGWLAEEEDGALVEEAAWLRLTRSTGTAKCPGLDRGHISPGWEAMFSEGLAGLINEANHYREALGCDATREQLAFYDAVEMVYSAAIALGERFAALARRMAVEQPEHAARLAVIAEACETVPAHGPRTFHQALQFHWLMHELLELEGEMVRSAGHFDRHMLPYYRADLAAGWLTREQARELIQFYWFKHHTRTRGVHNGKNFLFGGQDAAGRPIANELTEVALDAYERLNTPDPKLSVRFTPETPTWVHRRVAELIRKGHNSFVLMNDVPAVEAMVRRGKTVEEARCNLPIGCYEPVVDGKEVGCTMNLTLNLAKGVEYALRGGLDVLSGRQVGAATDDPRGFATFDALLDAYETQIAYLLDRYITTIAAYERRWMRINPSPLLAGTLADCLPRGRDVGEAGPVYNSVGCVGAELANACDSLLAIKRVVFDEGRLTMEELLAALDADFVGHEPMRQYLLHRVPKWGNGDPEADALGKRIADHYCRTVHGYTNARGGRCQAALFTLTAQFTFGALTPALPDGRRSREALAPGVGAHPGRDLNGATGLIESVTGLDFCETPNGAVLDLTLHPSAVRGEEGLQAFVDLIQTFLSEGGYALQVNVIDAETLREAQRNPEQYATLQIRVTGWSVFFVTLSRFEQDQFIARLAHRMN